jgi:hypothetical protein
MVEQQSSSRPSDRRAHAMTGRHLSPSTDRRTPSGAVPSHSVPGGRDAPQLRWRELLTAGSTVTSFPRSVRLAIAAAACVLPAIWLVRLITNWGDVTAAGYWMFVVLFSAPLFVLLPALRHRPDQADLRTVAEVRVQRHVDSARRNDADEAMPSRLDHRPVPPPRW